MSLLHKRRGRPCLNSTPETMGFDMKLIAAVKEYPIFYDENHLNYRHRETTAKYWDLVAEKLDVSAERAMNRMRILRIRYNIEKRKSETTWPLFKSLQYLNGKNGSADEISLSTSYQNQIVKEHEQKICDNDATNRRNDDIVKSDMSDNMQQYNDLKIKICDAFGHILIYARK